MREMSLHEIRSFLTTGTRTGKVAVVRRDGSPMVVPVWFGLDGDGTIVFTTYEKTVKAQAISREPRVSFCVDEEAPPYAYVCIDGRAELIDDTKLVRSWATRLGGRYMGIARAQEFGDRNAVPGEILVRIKPERIVAHADITGLSV